jgi:DNA-binding transcriptional ArsR family regulator
VRPVWRPVLLHLVAPCLIKISSPIAKHDVTVQLTEPCSICKFHLTGETRTLELTLNSEAELLAVLIAVANPLRLRVVAELSGGRVHVSELARRLGISRPLLYMHLDRLEKAGLVTGQLELSEDGKAMKYYDLAPFELRLDAQSITHAVRTSEQDTEMKETSEE